MRMGFFSNGLNVDLCLLNHGKFYKWVLQMLRTQLSQAERFAFSFELLHKFLYFRLQKKMLHKQSKAKEMTSTNKSGDPKNGLSKWVE